MQSPSPIWAHSRFPRWMPWPKEARGCFSRAMTWTRTLMPLVNMHSDWAISRTWGSGTMFLVLMRWCLMISQLQHSFSFLSFLLFFLCTLSTFLSTFLSWFSYMASLITLLTTIAYYLLLIASCCILYSVDKGTWEREQA